MLQECAQDVARVLLRLREEQEAARQRELETAMRLQRQFFTNMTCVRLLSLRST